MRVEIEVPIASMDVAREVRDEILNNYPPYGYGTTLRLERDTEGPNVGKLFIRGHRYDSCN